MTTEEKAAAFDALARAFTNQWANGTWTWWCANPAGGIGQNRATREEAVADLVEWATWYAKKKGAAK